MEWIALSYRTLSSGQKNVSTIAVCRNGAVINPRELLRLRKRGGEVEATVGGIPVRIVDKSSQRSYHIVVHVPAEHVAAIVREVHYPATGVREYTLAQGRGRIVTETERRVTESGNKVVVSYYTVHYYVDDGLRARIGESFERSETHLRGKPRLRVDLYTREALVLGDTYHVRDVLKRYGRWDSWKGVWIVPIGTVHALLRELEKIADVEVVDVHGGARGGARQLLNS